MRFLIFDTETTGLPETKIINPYTLHQWPSIVQFSYIIYNLSSNEIIEAKDYIIKVPENVLISEESVKIHGITNKISAEKGIPINTVLNEFYEDLINVDMIIGHNINFDINMIKVELLRNIYNNENDYQLSLNKKNLHFINNYKNIFCTLKESINFCAIKALDKYGREYFKYPKLTELHKKLFDSEPSNLHNSFNDVLVTLRCFVKLRYGNDLLDNCYTFKNYSNLVGL